jgi:hypothetical protein
MKTKDEGTAWLRSHGWVQCDRGWRKPGAYPTPMTTQQATTKQGEVQ